MVAPATLASGGEMVIECSSRPHQKAMKHHMKTRPRKSRGWDIRRGLQRLLLQEVLHRLRNLSNLTMLKQAEVDCEYLKRCCETLTKENRRLHKELQELRALTTSNPFCNQLLATTLTMCPSCERVATTSAATTNARTTTIDSTTKPINPFPLSRPRFYPFSQTPPPAPHHHHHQSAAS